jgi:hypothetical protein
MGSSCMEIVCRLAQSYRLSMHNSIIYLIN